MAPPTEILTSHSLELIRGNELQNMAPHGLSSLPSRPLRVLCLFAHGGGLGQLQATKDRVRGERGRRWVTKRRRAGQQGLHGRRAAVGYAGGQASSAARDLARWMDGTDGESREERGG